MIYFAQIILYSILHFPFKYFLKAKVEVQLGIEFPKPFILIANHQSRLDPFLLILLPFTEFKKITPIYFLTAEYYYNKWWLKPLIKILGAYPIKRLGWTIEDYLSSSLHKLQQGNNIMVFPEGIRVVDRQRSVAKSGIVYLATKTNTKLLPLRIDGISNLTISNFLSRKCSVRVSLGKEFQMKDVASDQSETNMIANKIMDIIYSL